MPVGKKDESALWQQKPRVATLRGFSIQFWQGGLCPRLATAYLSPGPAICRCSRRLHLPKQRVRKTKIYSWWHTPFLYLYRGGSNAHYTLVAEMPQEAIPPLFIIRAIWKGECQGRSPERPQRFTPDTLLLAIMPEGKRLSVNITSLVLHCSVPAERK